MGLPPGVVLWNVRAEGLVLSSDEWQYALELAASHEWQARGTRKPPVSFDGESESAWDGRYSPACGQEVTAADASHFGRVLRTSYAQRFSETMKIIACFASNGGFLVCPLSSHSASLTALMTALNAGELAHNDAPLELDAPANQAQVLARR